VRDAAADHQHGSTGQPRLPACHGKIGLTYRGAHVISDAEIVWYAIDNTG
jgi:hypothetical protein